MKREEKSHRLGCVGKATGREQYLSVWIYLACLTAPLTHNVIQKGNPNVDSHLEYFKNIIYVLYAHGCYFNIKEDNLNDNI